MANRERSLKRLSNQEPSSPGGGGDGALMCHRPTDGGGGMVNPCLTRGDVSRGLYMAPPDLKAMEARSKRSKCAGGQRAQCGGCSRMCKNPGWIARENGSRGMTCRGRCRQLSCAWGRPRVHVEVDPVLRAALWQGCQVQDGCWCR